LSASISPAVPIDAVPDKAAITTETIDWIVERADRLKRGGRIGTEVVRSASHGGAPLLRTLQTGRVTVPDMTLEAQEGSWRLEVRPFLSRRRPDQFQAKGTAR
jgi:hypothetical protein